MTRLIVVFRNFTKHLTMYKLPCTFNRNQKSLRPGNYIYLVVNKKYILHASTSMDHV